MENVSKKVTQEFQEMLLKRKYNMYKHARNSLDKLLIISNFVREIKGEVWTIERRYTDVVAKNDIEEIKNTIKEIEEKLDKLYDLFLNL
ncbi:hypothetical protein AFV8_gp18 [Betalipothrixvirus puteoliense]|uniref:Uncharacterized protein n=1 Tax=Betalipothrixvirus puteoliense TaxID=346884 RepID=A7WKU8_9VIRU|nr:hypothetical protein AFV8_gp18 [Acidianus filamentous virus 8]CAJ31695.1 conserved hypothetical protein [Acidianus filamentous virus 8]